MQKKLTALSFLLVCQFCLSGCEVLYDEQQNANKRQCDKLTDWNERKTCLQQNNTKYEDYEKQREDLRTKGTERK